VLPSGNGAALVLLVRTFDHFSLQDLFPHPCLRDRASKDTMLLFPLTPLTSHTAWLVMGLSSFSQQYLSVHASYLVCVSADRRGSMDWCLQDASDQFSFHMKHELLTTTRHSKPTHSPSFPQFTKNLNKLKTTTFFLKIRKCGLCKIRVGGELLR